MEQFNLYKNEINTKLTNTVKNLVIIVRVLKFKGNKLYNPIVQESYCN